MLRKIHQSVNKILTIILFIIVTLLCSCSHTNSWQDTIKWTGLKFGEEPGIKQYPDAEAITLLNDGEMNFTKGEIQLSIMNQHRIIKILKKSGFHRGNIVLPYSGGSIIDQIQARTISPNGKITVLDPEKIYDINLYPNYIFYSDQKAKIFTMPAIEEGCIIEYQYQRTSESYSISHVWNFQEEIPVLSSSFTIQSPAEWHINYKLYNCSPDSSIKERPTGYTSSYSWTMKNIKPLKMEFSMEPLSKKIGRIEFSPLGMKNWDDVANWYHGLTNSRINSDKGIDDLVDSLTKNISNKEEKAQIIYKWVRDNIRYLAIAIGIGNYQPHSAEEVLHTKYGDCKDMSTLLCSMLRKANITANLAMVSTWQNGKPDTSLVSPFHFNHIITYCPEFGDSGVWLDATSKYSSFNDIPWYISDLPIFILDKQGIGKFIYTPPTILEKNTTTSKWLLNIDNNGIIDAECQMSLSGEPAFKLRRTLHFLSQEEIKQWIEFTFSRRLNGIKIDTFDISGLNPENNLLRLNYTFHNNAWQSPNTNIISINPGEILNFSLPQLFTAETREHPVYLQYLFNNNFNLEINLSKNFIAENFIESDSMNFDFAKSFWNYKIKENHINIKFSYQFDENQIIPEKYPEFKKFLDNTQIKFSNPIIIRRKQ